MANKDEEMVVTPWKVTGKIDYDRLIQEFGTQPLTEELLDRIAKRAGYIHPLLKRGHFFSHRDLDVVLDEYDKGNPFVLYTGRGPSGPVHLGHITTWIFTKYLQDAFDVKLYFQMTDDEKFLIHPEHNMERIRNFLEDNILDVIAVGFKQDKTKIITDIRNIDVLYELAIKIARHVNFSTVKAVFGFKESDNIGILFFPAIQAVPAFLESSLRGRNVPCLIPAAIDQDPYWRIARDVAVKLRYYKPAQIHSKFLPGLGKEGKMSSSLPETCIFTTDSPKVAEKKIMNAYTGGQATVEEQKKLGGNPDVCPVFLYDYYVLLSTDEEATEMRRRCASGEILCGECKKKLSDKVKTFLVIYQKRREEAKNNLEKYLL
ncbi:MAG: tryptophan--tRNA ligase [Candidatus Bathyarchaeota archaeon]